MRKTLLTTIFLLITYFGQSQSYLTSEVIEKAGFYLKESVGEELFEFFELDPDSYYEYVTKSGKTKWNKINKGKWTKGRFINGDDIRFTLKHPEFPYLYINKRIYVKLDSLLNLSQEINLFRIPKFLLRNEPSDWLTDKELDVIITNQNLKKGVKTISKRIEFDFKSSEYYWIIFNTLYEEKCFSDYEILHINPVTGNIKKHYEDRYVEMHCN